MNKYSFKLDIIVIFKIMMCCLLIVSSLFSSSILSYGEELEGEEQPENDVGFSVEPIFPDTQIDLQKGFYFIKAEPDQSQELVLKIRSTNVNPVNVKVYIKNAYTNANGMIDYDSDNYKRDTTLVNSVEEITSVSENKVTVQNFEEKIVKIKIATPNEEFSGVKAGSICVMKDDSAKTNEGVSSTFGYRIGLLITEDSQVYDDGSSLNLLAVQPAVHLGKRVIQAQIQNPESKILEDLTIETKLYKKGSDEVIKKRKANNMRMAPNSQFEFSTNWGIDPLKNGTYILRVSAKSRENVWEWDKVFTIGEEQAKKINEEASFTITYPEWIPIVVMLIGITSILLIGFLYVCSKKGETL